MTKTQDRKFYIENNRLIGQSGPIPDDEPLFILRGRDCVAVDALYAYQRLAEQNGADLDHLDAITLAIHRFDRFRREHPARIKRPDTDLSKLHDGKGAKEPENTVSATPDVKVRPGNIYCAYCNEAVASMVPINEGRAAAIAHALSCPQNPNHLEIKSLKTQLEDAYIECDRLRRRFIEERPLKIS
jgi:hypothetical protein